MEKRRMILAISIFVIAGVLLSCSESNITTDHNNTARLATTNVSAVAAQKSHGDSPQKVFEEFKKMVKKVKTMSKAEIDSLSDEEVLELGEPILKATEGTVILSGKTLQELKAPAAEMASRIRSISKKEYNELSNKFLQVIRRYEGDQPTFRNLGAADLKSILLDYAEAESGAMQMSATCSSMFNTMGSFVFLYPGDNLNTANSICAVGSTFYVHQGTYYSQKIEDSKDGNEWVGINDPVLDGQNSVNRAFQGGMKNSIINGLTIKNYTGYGIYSLSPNTTNVYIVYMTFEKIGAGKNGEYFGAIRFDNGEDLSVRHSYFEDVASSILFNDSDGPLEVLDNEALNPGRNFVQCGKCEGGNIRINGNSIEHEASYGSEDLEDIINIYRSEGLQNDPIQVNNNRARTDGTGDDVSLYGSFIMLGDHGGRYQKAVDNIGVNTGNVGVGSLGGRDIEVSDNKMFSDPILNISNVAFSSYHFCQQFYGSGHTCGQCDDHSYSGNTAHWYCYRGDCGGTPTPVLNKAYSPSAGSLVCGITYSQITNNNSVLQDTTMNEDVWDEW